MKKNTWNVRRLVDEPFFASAQRTSVLYCRLSDFKYTIKDSYYGNPKLRNMNFFNSTFKVAAKLPKCNAEPNH